MWTVATGSLFLLTADFKTLFQGDGLHLFLNDFDSVGKHETLGIAVVSPKKIYNGTGERMELKLQPPSAAVKEVSGHIAVRCRRASEYDIQFMENLNSKKGPKPHEALMPALHIPTTGSNAIKSALSRQHRIAKHGPNAGKKEVRSCIV